MGEDKKSEENGTQFVKVEVIAQLFGVSVRRVQQITQEGIIKTSSVPGQLRKYELVPTIKTYIQYLSDRAYGRSKSEKESELKEQKLQAEIALKESQGELHRMKREIAAGKYIDREEVGMDYQKFFIIFKRFALGIPARLMSMMSDSITPMEARQAEKELNEEVKRMLTAFVVAGSEKQPAKRGRRKKDAQTEALEAPTL